MPATTVESAFTNAYPDWYLQATHDAVPKRLAEFRTILTTGLFRCLELPANTDERQLDKSVLKTLQDGWKQMGLVFPKKMQVVLCNQVNVPKRFLVSVHAGVLFSRQRGFTYLEKAGGSGPFVRLDLQAEKDLVPWLTAIFAGAERQGFTDHFVTFNDSSIMRLELEER